VEGVYKNYCSANILKTMLTMFIMSTLVKGQRVQSRYIYVYCYFHRISDFI